MNKYIVTLAQPNSSTAVETITVSADGLLTATALAHSYAIMKELKVLSVYKD